MNDERSNPDFADDGDRLVSETYRDLARERAPQALNKTILRRATAASRQGYLRSASWMRPMAWATTVGLCLAIVFEVTHVPPPESAVFDMSNDAVDLSSTEMLEKTVPLKMPPGKANSGSSYKSDARLPAAISTPERDQAQRSGFSQGAAAVQDSLCNEVATATPVTWLECIEQLENAGLTDAAMTQRALLQRSFPDFAPR